MFVEEKLNPFPLNSQISSSILHNKTNGMKTLQFTAMRLIIVGYRIKKEAVDALSYARSRNV